MDPSSSFVGFWSAQTPFIANMTLQQLRMWFSSSSWFAGTDLSPWFEVSQDRLNLLQTEFQNEWQQLGMQLLMRQPLTFNDRRFQDESWQEPLFGSMAAYYLLNSRYLLRLVEELKIPQQRDRERVNFMVEQAIAACAPSNFLASNPDALKHAVETSGASLVSGLLQLAEDIQDGKLRHSDRADFEVGKDLATTPGNVVFENDLFQLIQYLPQSETQYSVPMLVVPPAINKFYILDLRPENSLVRHALEAGHAVYLMSWRNIGPSQAHRSWDDYLQHGVITAIRTTRAIAGERKVNCLGYCVGGTLLASALAVLAGRGDNDIASLTLMTTFLDFVDTGAVGLFVDENMVAMHEHSIGGKGVMPGVFRGEDMANTFSLLRPNELWWNYSIDRYLKGIKPKAFDLLFWNNDSTNLPGPMYTWYLRHCYLQNALKSGEIECCGQKIDFGNIKAPAYVLGTEEDHIVPWKSAYASAQLLGGKTQFVLGGSGHIAGVVNPPAKKKRSYLLNEALPQSAEAWLEDSRQEPGSWWPHWYQWLEQYSGERKPAVAQCGNAEYPVIEPAPGRYVVEKAS